MASEREQEMCTLPGCDRKANRNRSTICEVHYYRMRRTGSYELSTTPRALPPAPCAVEDCQRRARNWAGGHHVCLLHKKRWDRHGHFEIVRPQSTPRPHREMCVVEGCGAIDDGPHGLCKMHKSRVDRHGDPTVVIHQSQRDLPRAAAHWGWTGDEATYAGVHQRISKTRGKASGQHCVDCGLQAKHWSYDHSDPNERPSELGPYSVDVDHYDPRCVPCHKKFDLAYLGKAA